MSDNHCIENAAAAAANRNILPEKPKFPVGLRVLTVDDDPTCLRIVSRMLEQCMYQVTSVLNATEALELLRRNREGFDVVLTDVRMPDVDGLELLKIIGLEMDIPVIMMSVDDSTDTVMKGVWYGARDYLVKPVRILELKNIWQHVLRKTVLDPEKSSLMAQEIGMENLPLKKRRGKDKEKEDVTALSDGASTKKRRFAWTQELHRKFVDAVNLLDADKAVPKQIVEIMDEPELTREIVASHLQKYRNFLRKNQSGMIEGRTYDAGQRGMHEAFLNPNPASYSDYNVLPMLKEANNGNSSGSGVMSFRGHLSQPDTLSNSQLNENFMIDSLNQQNLWSQQNYNPQISNQEHASKPIPVHGNIPLAQSWMANPPERVMMGDYVDMSSQTPNFGAVQSGSSLGFANFAGQTGHSGFHSSTLPKTEHASHPCPPGVFGINGVPYPMLDGTLNAFPGQHDGRVSSIAFNGGAGSDRRGYPVDFATNESRVNGQGSYMQLLTENLNNNHPKSSIDNEGKQTGPTSAPKKEGGC